MPKGLFLAQTFHSINYNVTFKSASAPQPSIVDEEREVGPAEASTKNYETVEVVAEVTTTAAAEAAASTETATAAAAAAATTTTTTTTTTPPPKPATL